MYTHACLIAVRKRWLGPLLCAVAARHFFGLASYRLATVQALQFGPAPILCWQPGAGADGVPGCAQVLAGLVARLLCAEHGSLVEPHRAPSFV